MAMRLSLALLALLLVLPASSLAQDVHGPSDPNAVIIPSVVTPTERTYGITAKTFLALTPWHFQPIDSGVTYQFNNTNATVGQTISRTNASGNPWFKAPLQLPDGVLVTEVEFVVCDTGIGGFSSFLFTQ